jgi:hypothetical protein
MRVISTPGLEKLGRTQLLLRVSIKNPYSHPGGWEVSLCFRQWQLIRMPGKHGIRVLESVPLFSSAEEAERIPAMNFC